MLARSHHRALPFAAFIVVLWQGCAWHPWASLKGTFQSKPMALDSSGPVAAPARLDSSDRHTEIPLIPGATVTISTAAPAVAPPAPAPNPPSAPAVATFTEHTEHVAAAINYPPPTPPTPADLAQGQGVKLFYWLAAGCALGAILAGYLGHMKAAMLLGAAAVVVPLLARLGQLLLASHLAVGLICAAIALVVAWEILQSHPELISRIRGDYDAEKIRVLAEAERIKAQAAALIPKVT